MAVPDWSGPEPSTQFLQSKVGRKEISKVWNLVRRREPLRIHISAIESWPKLERALLTSRLEQFWRSPRLQIPRELLHLRSAKIKRNSLERATELAGPEVAEDASDKPLPIHRVELRVEFSKEPNLEVVGTVTAILHFRILLAAASFSDGMKLINFGTATDRERARVLTDYDMLRELTSNLLIPRSPAIYRKSPVFLFGSQGIARVFLSFFPDTMLTGFMDSDASSSSRKMREKAKNFFYTAVFIFWTFRRQITRVVKLQPIVDWVTRRPTSISPPRFRIRPESFSADAAPLINQLRMVKRYAQRGFSVDWNRRRG